MKRENLLKKNTKHEGKIDSKLLGGIHERKEAQRRNPEHPRVYICSLVSSSGLFISARTRIKSRLSFLFHRVKVSPGT